MKRLLALVAGGLGFGALLRRRGRPSLSDSPADDLRAKLEAAKETQDVSPVAEAPSVDEPGVDDRRADAHARARQAIDDLGESS